MNKTIQATLVAWVLMTSCALIGPVQASVVISGTRVIFPAQEREVTVKLTNNGKRPALVQAWLDNGQADISPQALQVPFSIAPALFRLDPDKGQTLRVIYTQEPLPTDKESLFWLNVLEVPPKASQNTLQLSLRTRIKLIFRPPGLAGEPRDAPARVTWEIVADKQGLALRATNPTPYIVNLGHMVVTVNGKDFDAGTGYVAPAGQALFPVPGLVVTPGATAQVRYTSINDHGAGVEGWQPVQVGPGL
ncbi:fimbria/pilus periplasmic chaperone [Pseudomonas sp. LS1212]|uniref:fimbria/pilus periplasmic chaperone n=1 Tax=Pseudomonas sp. LS1212 TaxID=2972478 RepID=UPI00215CDE5A|nr:fimbria/pilus periplasmic chaperone [Pseudomonas sp. LS1212]UVJ46075.1 fimbria/pilus periplasmic chaperone [Pseudomonas sp. LS1212]